MSRINAIAAMMALAVATNAQAITNAELARLNNEMIGLDAQLAVAKKREELARYTSAAPSRMPQSGTQAPVMPPKQLRPPGSKSPRSEIGLLAIHGDPGKLVADFDADGKVVSRRKGESIGNGWFVGAVDFNTARIVQPGPGGRSLTLKLDHQSSIAIPRTDSGVPLPSVDD